jgi:hypothetical protein
MPEREAKPRERHARGPAESWHRLNLQLIVAEIRTYLPRPVGPQADRTEALLDKYKSEPDSMTLSEIFELDYALHTLRTTQKLLDELPMLRLRYKEAIGEKQYSAYKGVDLVPNPNLDSQKMRDEVLADVQLILRGLYREYELSPQRDALRMILAKKVSSFVMWSTPVWAGIVVLLPMLPALQRLWLIRQYFPVLATVMYFGALGAFVSLLRRTQALPVDTDSLQAVEDLNSVCSSLTYVPLRGAVFAIVLFLLFESELLSGHIFPKFDAGHWLPNGADEYAKLYVWSFISGFAERLVPDALNRLVQKHSGSSGSTSPPPSSS